jgi:hypothetical protein
VVSVGGFSTRSHRPNQACFAPAAIHSWPDIMDSLASSSPYERVVFMKGLQMAPNAATI